MSERDDFPKLRLVFSSAPGSSESEESPARATKDAPYVRLVRSISEAQGELKAGNASVQLSLFPGMLEYTPSLLAFLDMSHASGEAFTAMIQELRPRWLLDLRPVPRFDYGHLNRRLAFRLFAGNAVTYLDIAASLRIIDRHDSRLQTGTLARELSALFSRSSREFVGPIVFLVDAPSVLDTAKAVLPKILEPQPTRGWMPHTIIMRGTRYVLT